MYSAECCKIANGYEKGSNNIDAINNKNLEEEIRKRRAKVLKEKAPTRNRNPISEIHFALLKRMIQAIPFFVLAITHETKDKEINRDKVGNVVELEV